MDAKDKRKLKELVHRVRQAAKQLPTKGLQASCKAIGYRADKDTLTDEYCEVHGMTYGGMATESKWTDYRRSRSAILADLKILEDMGLAERFPGKRNGKIQPPTTTGRLAK
jgi:hypothetical protein